MILRLFPVIAILLIGACTSMPERTWDTEPGPLAVNHLDELRLFDEGQQREVSMQVSYPTGKAAYPVVVFSHGAFCYPQQYRRITDHWVSNGYVVIALNHQDSPNLGKLNPKVLFTLLESRAKDISFTVDAAADIQAALPGFEGSLDAERLAVSGHSFGAMMAQIIVGAPIVSRQGELVSYADERFDAAVILSGVGPSAMVDKSVLTEAAFQSINRPVFASGGTLDTGNVGTGEEFPWEWRMSPYTLSPEGDKYSLVLENSDHYLGGLICRENRGGEDDYQGVEIVRTLNTAFLDAYVKDDKAALQFLQSVDVNAVTGGRAVLKIK